MDAQATVVKEEEDEEKEPESGVEELVSSNDEKPGEDENVAESSKNESDTSDKVFVSPSRAKTAKKTQRKYIIFDQFLFFSASNVKKAMTKLIVPPT